LAILLMNVGVDYLLKSDVARAREYFERALAVSEQHDNLFGKAVTLPMLAKVQLAERNYAEALRLYHAALQTFQASGNVYGESSVLTSIGVVEHEEGKLDAARCHFELALKLSLLVGNRSQVASLQQNLGNIEIDEKNYAAARAHLQTSAALREELGDTLGKSSSLNNLADLEYESGNFMEALRQDCTALEVRLKLGSPGNVITSTLCIGCDLAQLKQPEVAARLLAGLTHIAAKLQLSFDPYYQSRLEAVLQHLVAPEADVESSTSLSELGKYALEAAAAVLERNAHGASIQNQA
jgi:tetratricopeptide (TPR) repeat protein